MLDSKAVAERDEQFFLSLHKPYLKEVLTDRVTGFEFESFMSPGDLVGHRFLFDEDRAKFAVVGHRGDGGFIESTVVLPDPLEHVGDEGGIDGLVDLECVHGFFSAASESTLRICDGKRKGGLPVMGASLTFFRQPSSCSHEKDTLSARLVRFACFG